MSHLIHRRLPLALAVVALTAAWPAVASAADCDVDVTDSAGYLWETNDDGSLDVDDSGEVGDGDTFDGTGELTLDGDGDDSFAYYDSEDSEDGCEVSADGTEVRYPETMLEGVAVSRSVRINKGPLRFGRIVDVVRNPTAAPKTVQLQYLVDYGSDSSTTVRGTSSGDTAFAVGDRWLAGSESDQDDTEYASLFDGPDGTDAFDEIVTDERRSRGSGELNSGSFGLLYRDVTIPAGGTVAYLHVEHGAEDDTNAATLAFARDTEDGPDAFFTGLTDAEQAALQNWRADADGDGVLNRADNCSAVANADQADLDGDGLGDVCDDDIENDGIPNAVEASLGTNPRSGDSDGDGVADGGDQCPALAGTVNGCPAPVTIVQQSQTQSAPGRALPPGVTLSISARRNGAGASGSKARAAQSGGVTVRTSGQIQLPQGVTSVACEQGRIAVVVKTGRRTVSTRVVDVKSDCTYRSNVTFKRKLGRSVRAKSYFFGSRGLVGRAAKSKSASVK